MKTSKSGEEPNVLACVFSGVQQKLQDVTSSCHLLTSQLTSRNVTPLPCVLRIIILLLPITACQPASQRTSCSPW
ncbi:hypothetical protein J4Q44_G00345540 [Coregonus suidteri]|uniref:Uncharacterized protein n=1 Tax=Coregonus suidteri TaxID=861788 RepID=A0AAN8KP99_9TELE